MVRSKLTLVWSIVLPQSGQCLGGGQLADVGRHQTHDKQSITAQVVLDDRDRDRRGDREGERQTDREQ